MAPFLARAISLLVALPSNTQTPQEVSFSVCLSPGCVADGAQSTLDKLQAMAPSTMRVQEGTCVSQCGKGPIVECVTGDTETIHTRISGDALLKLLTSSSGVEYAIDEDLWHGYNLVEQAHDHFTKKQYEQAIPLYKEGIELARKPAHALADSCNSLQEQDDTGVLPRQLAWLVRAYCKEAEAKLQVQDKEGALASARAACELSQYQNAPSLDALATACQAVDDAHGELQALKAYFDLPLNDNMPRDESNRRRTLGFRLQKLEREAAM